MLLARPAWLIFGVKAVDWVVSKPSLTGEISGEVQLLHSNIGLRAPPPPSSLLLPQPRLPHGSTLEQRDDSGEGDEWL